MYQQTDGECFAARVELEPAGRLENRIGLPLGLSYVLYGKHSAICQRSAVQIDVETGLVDIAGSSGHKQSWLVHKGPSDPA